MGIKGVEVEAYASDWSTVRVEFERRYCRLPVGWNLPLGRDRLSSMATDETCPNCGAQVLEGRLNCAKCGAVYPLPEERDLARDPDEQGDLPG